MNKTLLLLLGVCLTQAALRSEDLADKVFGPGREYVYKYEGEVKSGIPKSSDRFSGIKFECEARLQFKTDKEVLMRLEKIQLKTLRGELESPEERSLKKMTKATSKEIVHEQKHQDAFRQDHFSSSSAESSSKSFKTSSSSQESRETPSQEKWEQQGKWAQEETPRQETEQKTSSEEAGRPSSRQSGESSQRSSQSASREVSEEVPEQQLAELRRQLAKPVRVTYDQGRVLSIIAEKDEPQWSINIKRGALNLFQCTRNPKKADMMDADAREETSNVPFDKSPERLFRIIEEGVSGECETQYDIRRENNVEIITKAQNFQGAKCRSRPSITHSLFSGKIMEADIVQHMITTGEITMRLVTDASGKFLVQRAESRGTHSVLAYKEGNGEMETFVKQTLELIEAKTTISEPKIPEPTQPENKGSLVFVFAPEVRSQKGQEETKEKATLLCEEISRGLRETVAEETPKRFLELVGELQKMSKEQLKQFCTEKIPKTKASSKEQKAESETRKLIIDAVSMAGTEEALEGVWELLQENKISEGDAQSVIAGLSLSIKRCTAASVNIMLEIAKSKQALQYPELRKVAWLAVGTMVHKLTQAQPKETTEIIQLKSEYAKQLLHGIQPEKTDEEKMMCIKALGNAGLEDSVDRLAEIIRSKTTPTEIRLQAIYALRRIVQKLPHKTRNILYPVFKNPANPAEERIAAFVAMMDAGSELPVSFLELIAQSTQRETSNQVGNFVYTTLKSCAESRMPRDRVVRHACIRAMRHCRPFNLGIQYSHSSDWQAMSEEMKLGASLKIQTISDKRSVLPRAVTAKINLQALSYSVNFLEFGVRAAGMQTMVDALYKQYEHQTSSMYQLKKKSQETSREYRDSSSTERQRTLRNIEAEKIQSKLNIKTRTPEEPKGQIYVKANGNEIYFHQFRSDMLKKLVREDKLSFPEIEKQLQQGAQTSRTKASMLVDVSEIVATFLGLPMKAELKALAVTRSDIAGKMIVSPSLYRKESSGEEKSISNIEAELTSTHSAHVQITAKMTVDCRVIKAGVGLDASVKGLLPISGKVTLDMKNHNHKVTFQTPEKERELLVLKSRPIVFTEETAVRKTQGAKQVKGTLRKEITIQGEKVQRFPSQMKTAWGRQALGLEFALQSSMISRLNKERSAPFQPLTGPAELRLAVRPGENRPEEVEIVCRPRAVPATSSEENSREQRSAEQPSAMRLELDIRAKHPQQDRSMMIKIQTKDEQVEIDPRRREIDAQTERRYPRKLLLRSPREKEPEVSAETQQEGREDGKQQTRKTIAIQIERSRIPDLESWDFKGCAEMQLEYPTFRDSRLIQDGVVKTKVDAKWGADCSGRGPRVQIDAKFQKSVQQRRFERQEEAAEWDSRNSGEGLTQSQELRLESLLDTVQTLWMWEPKPERNSRSAQESSSMEKSRESSSRSAQESSSMEKSRESSGSSEEIQFKKLRSNLYKQCLKDRREGQRYSRACREAVRQRSQLRELDAEIQFQNIPAWLEQTCLAAHSYILNSLYSRSAVRQVGVANPPNQIRVRATLDRAEREMNVTIRTPRQDHNISRLPMAWAPVWFPSTRKTLTEQAMDTATKNKYTPFCKVQSNDKIRTFDDVEYKYKLSKCDHILAKDASPEEKFMVLVNKPEEHKPEKTVKVFIKSTKIELRVPRGSSSEEVPSQESAWEDQEWRQSKEKQQTSQQTSAESRSKSKSMEWTSVEEEQHLHKPIEVTIDGRQVPIQSGEVKTIRHQTTGKVICTLYCHGNGIQLKSPQHGLMVKVDNHNVEVKVSHDYRKKLVGLCGNFDGEQSKEYEGPREEVYKSPKEFGLSYLVPSKQCEVQGKKQPVMRNIMITRLNERNEEQACFSKIPVAQCPEGSRKTKSEVRSTEFHCLPKELQSTQKMIKLHKTKPLGGLQTKSTDLVQDVEAELECRE